MNNLKQKNDIDHIDTIDTIDTENNSDDNYDSYENNTDTEYDNNNEIDNENEQENITENNNNTYEEYEQIIDNNLYNNLHNINNNKLLKKNERISLNRLTKYEMVRILGERTKQLTMGAKPLVKNYESLTYTEIAEEELKLNMIPYKIKRNLPNGLYEIWTLDELYKDHLLFLLDK